MMKILGGLQSCGIDTSDGTIEILSIDSQTKTNEQREELILTNENNDLVIRLKETIPKLNIDLSIFTNDEATEIAITILKYADLFDTTKTTYGAAKGVEHTIETSNDRLISQVPHRVSPIERKIKTEMTNEILTDHVVRTSTSPWASPIVLVKKTDGKHGKILY
jgi:hypothetical protein